MKTVQLKKKYLEFFQKKGHQVIPSASLIPINDPTVLFNTAGMQPLVPFLMGQKHPQGQRLVNLQKCLRTVDFENVGDDTHHTFFQMLGNWSLGDYFKKESIAWSFEFLTDQNWLDLQKEKLAFTVYGGDKTVPKDEESAKIWQSLGVPKERIAYWGKDNFWSAGESGPCGPSTEIFYWKGSSNPPRTFDPKENSWVEIWNNVFMTYNRKKDGSLEQLKQKNVDTGMGYERTLAALTGQPSAYETLLFQPIIKTIEKTTEKKYLQYQREMRIIADHLRAAVFLMGDQNGIVPSNVDQGYVLRRLIRRAVRYLKLLGAQFPCLTKIAEDIIVNYSDSYPELSENREKVLVELQKEETKFLNTLETGMKEFEKIAQRDKAISGKEAFLLFQSYGFPLEITQELAAEKNIKVDASGFNEEYQKHQELSRVGAEKKFKGGLADTSGQTTKLHTITHLLNEALRRVLSKEIKQRGSNITPERLRFDFNFDRKLTPEEIKKVEDEVNRLIKLGLVVTCEEMELEKAMKQGAQAEFGVKYPAKVTVYSIADYSKEVCGGPHVKNTAELGRFKITKEESSAAGVRRIKAVVE